MARRKNTQNETTTSEADLESTTADEPTAEPAPVEEPVTEPEPAPADEPTAASTNDDDTTNTVGKAGGYVLTDRGWELDK